MMVLMALATTFIASPGISLIKRSHAGSAGW